MFFSKTLLRALPTVFLCGTLSCGGGGGGGGEAFALLGAALAFAGPAPATNTTTPEESEDDAPIQTVDCPLPCSITFNWSSNAEAAVHTGGGGYQVCYSTTAGFALATGICTSVPYVSGATAPTNTTIEFTANGTYYVRVAAFSALNAAGTASPQIQVNVD